MMQDDIGQIIKEFLQPNIWGFIIYAEEGQSCILSREWHDSDLEISLK